MNRTPPSALVTSSVGLMAVAPMYRSTKSDGDLSAGGVTEGLAAVVAYDARGDPDPLGGRHMDAVPTVAEHLQLGQIGPGARAEVDAVPAGAADAAVRGVEGRGADHVDAVL